ncbi:MucBP domain-containing protein [Carnobacterium maltaromaticum]|uniref:MucBP domain-containing protein n=1 Tax=Carnobacterium maltaromaticum TaxID=2751 RepID=UPI0018CDAFEF|nr:MucBP domain-containing protein [Carnobacterium maltaromaticum]
MKIIKLVEKIANKKLMFILGLTVCLLIFLVNGTSNITVKGKVKANESSRNLLGENINNKAASPENGLRMRSYYYQGPTTTHTLWNYFAQDITVKAGTYHFTGSINIEKSVGFIATSNNIEQGYIKLGDKVWAVPDHKVGSFLNINEDVTFSKDETITLKFGYGAESPDALTKVIEYQATFGDFSLKDIENNKEFIRSPGFLFRKAGVYYLTPNWTSGYFFDRLINGFYVDNIPSDKWEEAAQETHIEVKTGQVTYQYKDEEGIKLAEDQTITKNIGDIHKEDPISIEDYQYTKTIGSNPIEIAKGTQVVTFIYAKKSAPETGKVTIKYQDEDGKTLSEDIDIEGDLNSGYDAAEHKLIFDGYEYSFSEGAPLKGIYKSDPQTVSLVYRKLGKLTIKYLNLDGESIAEDKVSYGKIGELYTIKDIVIEGYLYNGDAPFTGIYKETEQTERLYYDKLGTVTFKYQDKQGTEIAKDEVYQDIVGEMYPRDKVLAISGYKYSETLEDGDPSNYGEVTSESKKVIYVYEENYFELLQEVSKLDGSNASTVALNEELIYTLNLDSKLEGSGSFYTSMIMTEVIDSSLEDPTDIKLTSSDGSIVGKTSYNSVNRKITASIKRSDNVVYSENLILSYRAQVKSNVSMSTVIKEKGNAKATYSDGKITNEKESNEVESKVDKGNLIFESAPDTISFGDDSKITSKKTKYYIEFKDGELSVKDLRGNGSNWSMTAKLTKLLTHENNTTLSDGIIYPYNGNDQLIGLESEGLIYEETTSSTDTISISNAWEDKITQPFVEVTPGVARKGTYSGVIQWTLRDVPSGHKLSVKGGIINE